MSPFASTSAARQSLNPALVLSLSSFTSLAGISMVGLLVLILFSFSQTASAIVCVFLEKWPGVDFRRSAGPAKFITLARWLANFLVRRYGRTGCFQKSFGSFRAFHKIAFLLLVLFVGAGVHVIDARFMRLIRRHLLICH